MSVEFAEHRPYVAGDDLRFLDWKVFGRTDKLHLKQSYRETNLDLWVLVDASGSMDYKSTDAQTPAPWRKFDCAATIAATVCKLGLDQRDRAAVWLFDDAMITQSRLSNATNHLHEIGQVLTHAPPQQIDVVDEEAEHQPGRTRLAKVFEQIAARLQRRSIITLISDLFDEPEAIEDGLARLSNRGHDVILLQVMDPAELAFPFRRSRQFRGLEGEGKLPLDPMTLRRAYLDALNEHLRRVEDAARKFGFDYLLVPTDQPVGPALSHFMARRAAAVSKNR